MTDWFMPPVNHLHAPAKRMALPGAIPFIGARSGNNGHILTQHRKRVCAVSTSRICAVSQIAGMATVQDY